MQHGDAANLGNKVVMYPEESRQHVDECGPQGLVQVHAHPGELPALRWHVQRQAREHAVESQYTRRLYLQCNHGGEDTVSMGAACPATTHAWFSVHSVRTTRGHQCTGTFSHSCLSCNANYQRVPTRLPNQLAHEKLPQNNAHRKYICTQGQTAVDQIIGNMG